MTEYELKLTPRKTYKTGEPCDHPGCLSHISHPCEGCGRRAGGTMPARRTPSEIRAYCEAASKGPWEGCHTSADGMASMIHIMADDCILAELVGWNEGLPQMKADATFCVNARADMIPLLDAVMELREQRKSDLRVHWSICESPVFTDEEVERIVQADSLIAKTIWLEDADGST